MNEIDLFGQASASPFDAIRRVDEHGEHWMARDLQTSLGYDRWQNFEAAIQRAQAAAINAQAPDGQFVQVTQVTGAGNLGPQRRLDYRLTRYAAYLLAMNADPRKSKVADAQTYFAVKTREAEVNLPAQRPALPDITTPAGVLVMAEQFAATARSLVAAEQRNAELEPAANSWNTLATAHGDLLVGDAAKILSRDLGITLGERRLFARLAELRWVYRAGDRRWRAYQSAIEAGWLTEILREYRHPADDDLVLATPQIRVTVKGLGALHAKLSAGSAPTLLDGSAS